MLHRLDELEVTVPVRERLPALRSPDRRLDGAALLQLVGMFEDPAEDALVLQCLRREGRDEVIEAHLRQVLDVRLLAVELEPVAESGPESVAVLAPLVPRPLKRLRVDRLMPGELQSVAPLAGMVEPVAEAARTDPRPDRLVVVILPVPVDDPAAELMIAHVADLHLVRPRIVGRDDLHDRTELAIQTDGDMEDPDLALPRVLRPLAADDVVIPERLPRRCAILHARPVCRVPVGEIRHRKSTVSDRREDVLAAKRERTLRHCAVATAVVLAEAARPTVEGDDLAELLTIEH